MAEIVATEDLGFFSPGRGGIAAIEGHISLGEDIQIQAVDLKQRASHWVNRCGAICRNCKSTARASRRISGKR